MQLLVGILKNSTLQLFFIVFLYAAFSIATVSYLNIRASNKRAKITQIQINNCINEKQTKLSQIDQQLGAGARTGGVCG